MTTYAFKNLYGDTLATYPLFAPPRPAHALTEGALEAVESVRRDGAERRVRQAVASIVRDVGRPAVIPYEGTVIPSAAYAIARMADAVDFEVTIRERGATCTVIGVHRTLRVGFQAVYSRGATAGASWHEPWVYEEQDDPRPVAIDAKARTGKVGTRSPGVPARHLRIVASPYGVHINVTTLKARLSVPAFTQVWDVT